MLVLALSGCATGYQKLTAATLTGGYRDNELGMDVVRVQFSGNGYTTRETAQSYWLWHCIEVTLDKGFDGFEILSDMRLSEVRPRIPAEVPGDVVVFERAVYVPVYVPNGDSNKSFLQGDVHLLKGPITEQPPTVFDAHKLKEALAPYVEPSIKSRSNVKPHIHEYLLPKGKLDPPAT